MTKEDFRNKIDKEILIIEEQSEFLVDELKYFRNIITNENRDYIYEDIEALKETLINLKKFLSRAHIKRRY